MLIFADSLPLFCCMLHFHDRAISKEGVVEGWDFCRNKSLTGLSGLVTEHSRGAKGASFCLSCSSYDRTTPALGDVGANAGLSSALRLTEGTV